jgi:hypothetical protein
MINLARTRPATLLVPQDVTPQDEVMERRRWNGKTFTLAGENQFRATTILGAAHYKNNYADDKEQWKEIDLTFDASNLTSAAPFSVQALDDRIGYTYISKKGGQIDVELLEVGGVPVNNTRFQFSRDANEITWTDVAPGINMKLVLRPMGAEIFKQLEDASAQRTFLWQVQEDVSAEASFRRQTSGVDANGDNLEILYSASPGSIISDGGRTYTRFQYSEEWTGRVSRRISPETRQKDWFTDPAYPVLIDAVTNENIVANADDGFGYRGNWYSQFTTGTQKVWFAGFYGGYDQNGAVRFQTLGVPQGATINSATLTVQATIDNGNMQATIYGDDVDDAAGWSGGNLPSGVTKTTANVNFTVSSTGTFTAGLTGIVQEIISRPGWSSSNDIRFALLNQITAAPASMAFYDYDQGQPNAARLSVDYTVAAGAIMNQIQFGNLGADLYNGALI